ncbi:AAA family ATPase [Aquamicrobium soli]|uniref:AAA family ATPase n=1 Tax=Aquamicrobium soli TaxID=1811518 RepID=A0ABV7K7D0_9HYPH
MRLRRLDLTRYGKFTDHSIDFGERTPGKPDLHIVYGLNEAGKSTALSGFLDLLFGIEERTRYGFLHQGKAMEIGACLEFDGKAHAFKRLKQRSNSLLNEYGQLVNEAILSAPLAGLTRETYRMMFSLDDQTLEDGGNAILESKGDLGELLFSASAGLAGISSILEKANEEADGIFRKRASSTRIARLKHEMAALKSRRDEIDVQASAYKALTAALQQASSAYEEVMRDIGMGKARQDEIARLLRAYPLSIDYRRIATELEEYEELPHPPAEWSAAVLDLMNEETRFQTQMSGIGQRQERIREELEGLVVDDTLLKLSDRFDRLPELASRYTTAESDLPKRKAALAEWSRKVDFILAALGKSGIEEPRTLLVPAATIGTLRDLIAERSGIDVARRSAEKECEAAEQALEKAKLARAALNQIHVIDAGTIARLQSIHSRLRQTDLMAEHRLADRSLPDKQQAFDNAMVVLHPWAGDGDALLRIAPPASSRLEHWKSVLGSIDKRRLQYAERKAELAMKRAEDTARIDALHAAAGIIDDSEAAATLAERDEAWTQHLARLDRDSAHRFEDKMRRTDTLSAARLERAKDLEELRSRSAALAVTRATLARLDELLLEIDDEAEALRAEIRAETPAEIKLAADVSTTAWLARIERWAGHQEIALSAWENLQQTRRNIEAARTALEAEQSSIAEVLNTVGVSADDLPLAALIQAAETVLAENTALRSNRTEAENRLNELNAILSQRKSEQDKAISASNEWHRLWSNALAGTWFADRQTSVSAVRELLEAIVNLPEALRESDDLDHRIDAMEADRRNFAEAVAELCVVLGQPFDGADPLAAARALSGRHEAARQILVKRQERGQALVDLSAEREQLVGEIAFHDARNKEMTGFFGVETLADVREALERCRKRKELVEQLTRTEKQISGEMQQQSLAAAMAVLAEIDLAALQQEQAELTTRLDDLQGRSRQLFADKTRASDKLNAIGGDDVVARIEAMRRTVLLEIEDLAIRYLRLKTGSLVADHALRAYRDKHRSAMMNRASEAFRLMTHAKYTGLATRPQKDQEALIGLSRSGGSKLAVDMSKGTRFQLYLALRLAGYEEFAAARPSVPFIADDIMETFDEPRSEQVFRLFGQMAGVGQVIYLTHHRHLCEIAARVVPQAKIHELE